MNKKQNKSLKQLWQHTLMLTAIVFMSAASPQILWATDNDNPEVQQGTRTISGKIVDKTGMGIPGATVQIKSNTSKAAVTDVDGKYTLSGVKTGDVLVIRFMGMKTQEIAIGSESLLDATLEEDTVGLDEVVVVGYGQTTERKMTAAVTSVKASELEDVPVVTVTQSLAGRASGLIVTQSGGGINANGTISIRGGGTPLVSINGIISSYSDFELINPEDISTMTILKDASATAIYGQRAANGIIVITTKPGKGKPSIKYSTELMWTKPTTLEGKLNAYDRAVATNGIRDLYAAQGVTRIWTDAQLQAFKDGSDPYNYPDTDWQSLTMKDYAPQQKHSLSFQGGDDITSYYMSLGVMNQGTIFKDDTNWQDRYNFRAQFSSLIESIGLRITPSVEGYYEKTRAPYSATAPGGVDNYYYYVFSHIQNQSPANLAYNENGDYYSGTTDHPLVEMSSQSGYHRRNNTRLRGQLDAKWDVPWVDGLDITAKANYSTLFTSNKYWNKTAPTYGLVSSGGQAGVAQPMSLSKSQSREYEYTLQYLINYQKTFFEDHTISFNGGYEATYGKYDGLSAGRSGYLFPIDQISAGPNDGLTNGSSESEYGRAGLVARLKYDYANKYIAEFSMRRDGSDYFPKDNRWGTFFAISLAWNLHEEKFFDYLKEKNIFNTFKLRASYGETGQFDPNSLGRFAYLTSYGSSQTGYVYDGKYYPIFWEGSMASPDISWETYKSYDVGFDFSSLRSRLKGSFDYYFNKYTGFLASPSSTTYTGPLGFSLPMVRSDGEKRRAGFDLSLSWNDKIGDLEYTVGGNYTYFDELVSKNWSESESAIKNPYQRNTQKTGYYTIGYYNQGYYVNANDVMNSPRFLGATNLVAGDIKYADFNGDGKIDGNDASYIGKSTKPRANYGIFVNLKWKGVFVNALFQGATRRDIYIDDVIRGSSANPDKIIYGFQNDYWTPDNTGAKFPRPQGAALGNNGNNYVTSDFWLVNAAYFRMKTLQIGYDLKFEVLKKINWLTRCQVTLSAQNLFTISDATKYGYDPETASTNNYGYPVVKTYSIGLNIGF